MDWDRGRVKFLSTEKEKLAKQKGIITVYRLQQNPLFNMIYIAKTKNMCTLWSVNHSRTFQRSL